MSSLLTSKHIHLIAVNATAAVAAPTIGALGTNISQSAWSAADYDTIGSQQIDTHDHDLDAEALDLILATITTPIKPPRSLAQEASRFEGGTLEPFEFSCFGIPEQLIAFSSNMTIGSNKAQMSTSITNRTLVIEFNGLALLYMPQAELLLKGIPVGTIGEDSAKATFEVKLNTDSTYAGGWYFEWRQA